MSMTQFSVLSLNINMGLDIRRRRFVLPALRDAIRSVGADVVLLQEVLGEHAGHARRHAGWPSQPQHEYLADTLWRHHAYGRNAVFTEGHQGNAVLSRFPISSQQNHDVSIIGHEPRGLLHATLDVPGLHSPLHVISVHLGLRESHRQCQVAALCDVARAIPRDAPVLVAGDFNDWRLRGHAPLLSSGLHEAFESAHGRLARTFPARLPLLPLDRMYLRNLRTVELAVLGRSPWDRLSDHAGLHASLTW
jgi:endonuclease/exonuclease/phosphatase family metal-dependent hydrolase